MATKYVDFLVTGDPARARATAEKALIDRKFKVSWTDDWTGTAERGNKALNVVAGALAQYFKVGVRIFAAGPDETTVRLEQLTSGWAGGGIGVHQTRKNLEALRAELEAIFSAAGVLRGVTTG